VPDYNDGNARLLNVALTRARRRLIVVGDFTWLHQKAHRHSILRQLADHLRDDYSFKAPSRNCARPIAAL
jgi:ATP-dependent exoDNAse (exonuclease V) beta subunit